MQSEWLFSKTEPVSSGGMVASKHWLATAAGLEALRRGGNAVDAAVTAALVSGVVEPWNSGLGGGGRASRPVPSGQRGRDTEMFGWPLVQDQANIHGWRCVAVPGAVAGLALETFGTMSWAEVMQPAIRFAEAGFPCDWWTALHIAYNAANLRRYPETARIFLPDGLPIVPEEEDEPSILRQPELAATLRELAADGRRVIQGAISTLRPDQRTRRA